jgi:hypothetical protein
MNFKEQGDFDMTDKQWEQAMEQLPKGAVVVRKYTAFENGETRWVVRLADGRETRYIVHFEGEDVRLEHRP